MHKKRAPALPPPQLAPEQRTPEAWIAQRDRLFWCPGFQSGFLLLAALRVFGAASLPLADCDETFNYWEPTHYLMYGRGLQTWEYRSAALAGLVARQ
jgi:hypothetical protein